MTPLNLAKSSLTQRPPVSHPAHTCPHLVIRLTQRIEATPPPPCRRLNFAKSSRRRWRRLNFAKSSLAQRPSFVDCDDERWMTQAQKGAPAFRVRSAADSGYERWVIRAQKGAPAFRIRNIADSDYERWVIRAQKGNRSSYM